MLFRSLISYVLTSIFLSSNLLASANSIESLDEDRCSLSSSSTLSVMEHVHNVSLEDSVEVSKELKILPRELRILSIDGGGIRGIIPLFYLAELETRMNRHCYEVFDVIAGTSTGGMIALALSIGIPAKDILKLYLERNSEIFVKNHKLTGPKYKTSKRRKIFREFFGNIKLSEAKVPVLITAFEIERNKAFRFCSQYPKTNLRQKEYDMLMSDAALATSAAPTYFKPETVYAFEPGEDDVKIVLSLIDGGVFANNPVIKAMCYAEALYRGSCKTKSPMILSLGTGYEDYSISAQKAQGMGKLKWAIKLFPVLLSSTSGSADDDMDMLLGENYDRVTTHLDHAEHQMDKVGENIPKIIQDAENMLQDHHDSLEKWVKILTGGIFKE